MMDRFAGRTVLVTGGARGIGAAIARRLAAEGASVLVGDIDGEGAGTLAAEIGATAVALDVTDPGSAHAAVQAAGATLDVLVNNAAIDDRDWFTDTTPERWRRLLAVNLEGVLACTQAALPGMQRAGYGRIVSIASEAGRGGAPGDSVYAASKGAVIAFTKSLARENGRFGITVNAVAPGPIDTPMLRAMDPRVIEAVVDHTQLRRLGRPEEVAAAVAFLAAEEAGYVTGEVLGVSGGMGLSS